METQHQVHTHFHINKHTPTTTHFCRTQTHFPFQQNSFHCTDITPSPFQSISVLLHFIQFLQLQGQPHTHSQPVEANFSRGHICRKTMAGERGGGGGRSSISVTCSNSVMDSRRQSHRTRTTEWIHIFMSLTLVDITYNDNITVDHCTQGRRTQTLSHKHTPGLHSSFSTATRTKEPHRLPTSALHRKSHFYRTTVPLIFSHHTGQSCFSNVHKCLRAKLPFWKPVLTSLQNLHLIIGHSYFFKATDLQIHLLLLNCLPHPHSSSLLNEPFHFWLFLRYFLSPLCITVLVTDNSQQGQ